jgi:hypothetical protein
MAIYLHKLQRTYLDYIFGFGQPRFFRKNAHKLGQQRFQHRAIRLSNRDFEYEPFSHTHGIGACCPRCAACHHPFHEWQQRNRR